MSPCAGAGSRSTSEASTRCGSGPRSLDAELADALKELLALRGGRGLFRYRATTASSTSLTDRHLNQYVQEHMGDDFTVKDFRTWGGTLLAAIGLAERGTVEAETAGEEERHGRVPRGRRASSVTRPRSARASYISPPVIEQYLDGRTIADFRPRHLRVVSRARYRARSGRASAAQPASLVANSGGSRGRVVPPAFVARVAATPADRGGNVGEKDRARLRQLQQRNRGIEGRRDAHQLQRRAPRLEAGRPVRHLRREACRARRRPGAAAGRRRLGGG